MELAQILRELGRHRRWLAVAVVVAIAAGVFTAYPPTLDPPGLERKPLEIGAASTEVVIDTRTSSIIDLAGDFDPLAARAQTYARLGGSTPIRRLIARRVGVPETAIVASTPGREPGSEERADDIRTEQNVYRLFFSSVENQPLIDISAQAPTAETAAGLANGAAAALRQYVLRQQNDQRVPPGRRVTLRQIGTAEGGVINEGVNVVAAVLTGVAVFIGLCLLILFVTRTRADLQRGRAADASAASWLEPSEPSSAQGPYNGNEAAPEWGGTLEPLGRSAAAVSEDAERVADRR